VARWEPILVALFFAGWIGALLHQLGILALEGSLTFGLYPLFGLGSVLGWTFGNVYLHRRRGLPKDLRRRLLLLYLVGPPGLLYLLWSMQPAAVQEAAPLVPLLGFAVSSVFFLVPLSLAGSWSDPL
jgi:hypothetical protein